MVRDSLSFGGLMRERPLRVCVCFICCSRSMCGSIAPLRATSKLIYYIHAGFDNAGDISGDA